nr:sigma-E factor regulatory protein RseB domain-containing protein [Streptomonospora nanhaiensis]
MLAELAANYRVTRTGGGVVCGRNAAVLEVLRADGTAAARVWIDQRTALPLRKVVLDDTGAVVHATEFVEVEIGGDPGPLPEDGVEARPWKDELSEGELTALREDGWPLPEHVAWNLRLIRAWSRDDPEGRVVHLAYSDGLSVVSVFVQRGRLPGGSGQSAEAAADTLAQDGAGGAQRVWDSRGFVYTAMGEAPADLLAAAERGFPTDGEPEFWARVMRGFGRLTAAVQG